MERSREMHISRPNVHYLKSVVVGWRLSYMRPNLGGHHDVLHRFGTSQTELLIFGD